MEKMRRVTVTLTPELADWLTGKSAEIGGGADVSWLVRRALRHYIRSGAAADELGGLIDL
jgi:metal-responsive CopG/Arc/MetJ family transcriptional regulator